MMFTEAQTRVTINKLLDGSGLVHYRRDLMQGSQVKVSRFLPPEQLGKAA
jgi:hypothetical protein